MERRNFEEEKEEKKRDREGQRDGDREREKDIKSKEIQRVKDK